MLQTASHRRRESACYAAFVQGAELTSRDEIIDRIETALAASIADETEIVWHELARCSAGCGPGAETAPPGDVPEAARKRSLLVRVYERGRVGIYRTGAGSRGEVDDAVRQALGQAKVDPPPAHRPPLIPKGSTLDLPEGSYDPAVAALGADQARELLSERLSDDESAHLRWAEARIAAANSRGLRRLATVTAIALEVRCGEGPGAGYAAAAARSLGGLGAETVLSRARSRRADESPHGNGHGGDGGSDGSLAGVRSLVLSAEAVASLLEMFNHQALSARPFLDGTSWLAGKLGEPLFDPVITLRDEPLEPAGLAFPFDFFGGAKERLTLIDAGVVKTPATDSLLGPALGLPVIHLAIGPDDSRAGNLSLAPGELAEEELLAAAGDGVWIGWLDEPRAYAPGRPEFRAGARGVRAIRSGKLGPALPDTVLEDRLPRLFGEVLGIGRETVCVAAGDDVLESVRAPTLAVRGGLSQPPSPRE